MSDDKAIRAALLTAHNLGGRVWHRAEGGPVDNPEEGFTAYHGSPHSFDRFDINKIGTGEGAQAYGHGLYFAQNEGVAKGYRDSLTDPDAVPLHYKGKPVDVVWNDGIRERWPEVIKGMKPQDAEDFTTVMSNLTQVNNLRDVKNVLAGLNQSQRNIYKKHIERELVKPEVGKGHMYEAHIKANPDHFLDWDKPLSEQHPHVKMALAKIAPDFYHPSSDDYDPKELGQNIYQRLVSMHEPELPPDPPGTPAGWWHVHRGDEGQPAVTRKLHAHGVRGIKYLDAGSRGKGDGTRNYVVFDDKLINVKRKYERGGDVSKALALTSKALKYGNH